MTGTAMATDQQDLCVQSVYINVYTRSHIRETTCIPVLGASNSEMSCQYYVAYNTYQTVFCIQTSRTLR